MARQGNNQNPIAPAAAPAPHLEPAALLALRRGARTAVQTTQLYGMLGGAGAGMRRNFPHNYLDVAAAYPRLLPAGSLRKDFSLATTNVQPFVGQNLNRTMFTMAGIYGLGRYYLEGDGAMATLDKGLVVGIGEVLAPGMPDHLWLNGEPARAKCIAVVRALMANPGAFAFLGINVENFIQRGHDRHGLPDALNLAIGAQEWRDVDIPINRAMAILYYMAEEAEVASPHLPVKMLVTILVSTVKKGSTTDPFLNKILLGLRTELGIDIQVPNEMIIETYRAYGNYISSQVARTVIENWKEWIPETALRLQLTVNQAVWEGLTGFNTVKRAVQGCSTFPWQELAAIPIL